MGGQVTGGPKMGNMKIGPPKTLPPQSFFKIEAFLGFSFFEKTLKSKNAFLGQKLKKMKNWKGGLLKKMKRKFAYFSPLKLSLCNVEIKQTIDCKKVAEIINDWNACYLLCLLSIIIRHFWKGTKSLKYVAWYKSNNHKTKIKCFVD